ncbi:MAG: DUF4340 domain-containing protein [Lentisphaerae bacterium]|jgi:hypothetical protein|nr:DUF4340 domain-containing protein [Lentisphaerota bacterium]
MKSKQLLILLVIAVVLGIVYFATRPGEETWGEAAKSGRAALLIPESELDPTAVAGMTFTGNGKTVNLVMEDGSWIVKERFGYPANMDNLKSFLVSLTDCTVARELTLSETQKEELKLDNNGAVTVQLKDASGTVLKTILFGAQHTREMEGGGMPQGMMMMGGGGGSIPNGRFILKDGKPVLVSETFSPVDSDVAYWLDKEFFKIEDIKTAELIVDGKSLWKLARGDKNADLVLDAVIPDDKETDSTKLSSVKNAFSWIRFNDVADPEAKPEDIGFAKTKTFIATDFDDFKYTIDFGEEKDGKRFLKIKDIEWIGEATRKPGADEKPEDKKKLDDEFAKSIADKKAKAVELDTQFAPWIYEVGTYSLSSVDKSFEDFLKDKPKPEPEPEKKEEPKEE